MAPPPDVHMHELLAEGDFVRALARQLVGTTDADDVAQDAWLAVLRQRPANVREPRSWLARVVHRLAANRVRGERRRAAREREAGAHAPCEAPSTDAILACEQVRQRVVAAVLALDEPFRGTVLARYYECLDSDAIAARDGVEVATVRSRLKRGIERLRAQLDAEHGGRRAAWAAPLGLLHGKAAPLALPTGVFMSTSKKMVAIAAVIVLAGLGWWVASPDAAGAAPAHAASQVAALPSVVTGERRPGTLRVDAGRDGGVPSLAANAPRERVPYRLTDEPTMPVTVRVLDLATRRPVADAEVIYQPFGVDMGDEHNRSDRELHEMVSTDVFLERFGHRTRSDANGEAVIELPRRNARVRAQHGDRIASAWPDPEQLLAGERLLLWLDDARCIRLRVVDEATRAPIAGALLHLSSSATGPVVPVSCGYGGQIGPSDREGLIRVRWERDRTSLRVRPWTLGGARSTALELPAALERVTEVPYPATGSLTIELRTPSGQLWPSRIDASVAIEGGEQWASYGPTGWCCATPGTYFVPNVSLGSQLRVSASPDRFYEMGAKAVVAGPTRAGEDTRVVLHTPTEPCIVWADVRFADGSIPPLGSMANVLQDGLDRDPIRRWGYLESGGRVGWTVALGVEPRGQITLLRANDSVELVRGAWQLEAATPGVHELGTIVLKEPDVVVAGRVDRGARPWSGPELVVDCETPAADGTWQRAHDLSAPVRSDGAFEVRGVTKAERLRVSLRGDRRVLPPDPVVVTRGARDLKLQITSSVVLHARVLPPPAYLQAVNCRAVRADGAPLPTFRERSYDEDGTSFGEGKLVATDGEAAQFTWPALPAGIYSIEVRLPGLSAPVRTIDGIRVEDDAEPDARLLAIDLRRDVRLFTVAVEPLPDGARPITDGGALVWPSGQAATTRHGLLFDAAGRAQFVIGADPVDVLVAVPGCRLWRAANVTATSLAVQLEPCHEIAFRLAPRVAEAFAGHAVVVAVEPRSRHEDGPAVQFLRAGDREAEVQSSLGYLARLTGDGRCTLEDSRALGVIPVSDVGTFQLQLWVGTGYLPVNEAWLNWQRSPLLPATVECTAADQPPVVIDVDDEVLPKIVDQLSRRR